MKHGWLVKKLGDVCVKGSSNVSQNQLENDKGSYPIYGASGFIKNVSFYHQTKEYVSVVKDGAGIGRIALLPPYSSVIGTLQYLIPKEILDVRYFYYFLSNIDFRKYKMGSTIPHIYYKDYSVEPILVPPLPEQQRIASILDEAFAAIAKAKSNAEQNLKNAKELFEGNLQTVFENKAEGWDWETLGEACEFMQGIQRDIKLQSETLMKNQVRFLRIVDFTQGNEPPRYIDNPGEKYIVSNDDISLVRYGASTGFVCRGLVGALANNLFRVIPKSNREITKDFLFTFLNSALFQKVIKRSMNGAAMPAISFGMIKDIPFPNIPIKAQQSIVSQVDSLSAETKKLQSIYQEKINALDELKKSILQKAFSGRLKTSELIPDERS